MFTGIITEIGEVTAIDTYDSSAVLTVAGPRTTHELHPGQSIAVAGVCLTATALAGDAFTADVMRETLRHTRLGELRPGDRVNLERALEVTGQLDGHIVQGHADGVARLARRAGAEAWEDFDFELEPGLNRYLATKGSVAVDGVSLTVTRVWDTAAEAPPGVDAASGFGVSLIPTTLQETTLGALRPGAEVNIETDVLAKYVGRLMARQGE